MSARTPPPLAAAVAAASRSLLLNVELAGPPTCRAAFKPDTKVANAGTFTIQREDHTVGNLVRM